MNINFWEIIKNMLPVIWNLWPLWLFVILIIAIRIIIGIVLPNEFKKLKTALRFNKGALWRKDQELLTWKKWGQFYF